MQTGMLSIELDMWHKANAMRLDGNIWVRLDELQHWLVSVQHDARAWYEAQKGRDSPQQSYDLGKQQELSEILNCIGWYIRRFEEAEKR